MFDARKSLFILGILSIGLLFSSISIPEPTAILLGQISTEAFVNNRAVIQVSDCTSSNAMAIDALQIEGDKAHFTVHEIGLHDGFGSSEHLYLDRRDKNQKSIELEQTTCVAALEVIGTHRSDQVSKRSIIRVWGLRN